MKPCDVQSEDEAKRLLHHQGLKINDNSIEVHPASVILTLGNTTVKITQHLFKKFAEWYLENQDNPTTASVAYLATQKAIEGNKDYARVMSKDDPDNIYMKIYREFQADGNAISDWAFVDWMKKKAFK